MQIDRIELAGSGISMNNASLYIMANGKIYERDQKRLIIICIKYYTYLMWPAA